MPAFSAINSTTTIGIQNSTALTPGAVMSLDVTLATLYTWTAGENETVNATGTQKAGQILICKITNDATLPRTTTFGTGFDASATVVGTTTKKAIVCFISDGTTFYEFSRTLGLV